jgi:sucrose-6-phosphate hydrolase SacC (GH32 family)
MQPNNRYSERKFGVSRRELLRQLGIMGGIAVTGWVAPTRITSAQANSAGNSDSLLRVGAFTKIYDPSEGEKERWYINDHTFIRAEDGQWHLFGITHREPAKAMEEKFFAHATAPDINGPWTKQAPVVHVDPAHGETVTWAPYVLHYGDLYYMFYCAGGKKHTKYHIHLATSKDLFHWQRHSANPMVVDGYDARDPMVFRRGDDWILYYAATSTPEGGNHTVKAATSHDLVHWANQKEVFRDAETGTYGGPTESPFVVSRNHKYYLFICTNHGYNETAVYESGTPLHWDAERLVGKFPAHAAEVIETPDGKWYVSRAGWGQGGVYLAKLTWQDEAPAAA